MVKRTLKTPFDFGKMVVFDFGSINATSKNNCFGCDAMPDNPDDSDNFYSNPHKKVKSLEVPVDKYEKMSTKELLKHVAVTLDKVVATMEQNNKTRW